MANSNSTQAIESLAAEIGDKIYIDVAKWHLYLCDAHLHTAVAEQLYPFLENQSITKEQVQNILKEISVKLGAGKTQLPLLDLLPQTALDDLMDILEEYQKEI
ncbi:MAG: DUF3181 family protein [Halothece sp.]